MWFTGKRQYQINYQTMWLSLSNIWGSVCVPDNILPPPVCVSPAHTGLLDLARLQVHKSISSRLICTRTADSKWVWSSWLVCLLFASTTDRWAVHREIVCSITIRITPFNLSKTIGAYKTLRCRKVDINDDVISVWCYLIARVCCDVCFHGNITGKRLVQLSLWSWSAMIIRIMPLNSPGYSTMQ